MKPLILICSQDTDFYLLFRHILEADDFVSDLAGSVEEALALAVQRDLQAVVLDCQPGNAIGPAICAGVKNEPRTGAPPVVALIAPGAEHQHLDLLKAGVDESFVRPVAPAKLLAYLHARLGTGRSGLGKDGRLLFCGDLEMHLVTQRVRLNGQEIKLGSVEFNLLRHMLENPGEVFSREQLIGAAWPDNIHVDARTVDVHISRLRKELRSVSATSVIRTVRSAGYAIDSPEG